MIPVKVLVGQIELTINGRKSVVKHNETLLVDDTVDANNAVNNGQLERIDEKGLEGAAELSEDVSVAEGLNQVKAELGRVKKKLEKETNRRERAEVKMIKYYNESTALRNELKELRAVKKSADKQLNKTAPPTPAEPSKEVGKNT